MAAIIRRHKLQDFAQNRDELAPDFGSRQNFLRIIEKELGFKVDIVHGRRNVHSQTPEIDSRKIKLLKVLENKEYEGAPIEYEYDFGDCWTHQISMIGRAPATVRFQCLDGEGHEVAEDVGSQMGWKAVKEAYRASRPDKEQKDKMR